MESIGKMIAENMKQVDCKQGIEILNILIEAYIKSDTSDKTQFLKEEIKNVLDGMTRPIFVHE